MMTRLLPSSARRQTWTLHREWIAALLEKYYDPMYDYQLSSREGKLFRGTASR